MSASQKNSLPALPASFWPLNICQALGAMNDNVFQLVMSLALVARASDPSAHQITATPLYIAGIIFPLPFILLSSAAGVVADRFRKQRLIVVIKAIEVVVTVLGLFAFLSDSPILLYSTLFLMTTHSTFFGPCKLGILPEMVPMERLSYANGLMGMFSYLAIIVGTAGGAGLYHLFGAKAAHASTFSCWRASLVCIAIAVVGLLASLFVKDTGARTTQKTASVFFWKDVARNLRKCRDNRYLYLALFAIGFFTFLGGYVKQNVVPYGANILGLDKDMAAFLFLATAFGIGAGSYLAGKLSGRAIEIGLVPVGALISAATLLYFAIPTHSVALAAADLFLMGVGGGLYIVPLDAFLQQEAPEKDRGEIIATSYFLSFCGVALSGIALLVLDKLKADAATNFFLLGALTLVLTIYVVRILPDFLIRFIGLIITRLVYRMEVVGAENIPVKGGALLVCNHVSYADAVLLMATQQRRIRFVMERGIYENKRFNRLFRVMGGIPIASDDPPKEIIRSLRRVRQAIEDGWLVCIFAEGGLTRTGYIMEFKRGFERIMKGAAHPIIPINLHGVWGSVFSYYGGRILAGFPHGIGRRVVISFGSPLPSNVSAFRVRQSVMELESAAFERHSHRPLPIEFARMARSRWRRFCMADTTGKRLTFGQTLTAALVLAGVLRRRVGDSRCVGLLLPTSVGGALANLAVSFLSKISVNLNYTAPRQSVESAIRQCGIRCVLTSRAFVGRVSFADLPGLVFLEDLLARATMGLKIWSLLRARLAPLPLLLPQGGANATGTATDGSAAKRSASADDTVAIIFSSGSTGEPKGVELSHYNIGSNVEAAQQVLRLTPDDVVCGVLPFFHSFGFTGTLWLPLLAGIGVAYHYNPTEAETIGKMAAKHHCTLLVATPTFLLLYTRKIAREQFATLCIVIAGAEKLKERIATAFRDKFGLLPFEGYGATELSPVAAVNVPNVEVGGMYQEASKPGSIGRPIPGVTMKVVDPDDFGRELNAGDDGMLLVKGPNVMKGYLGKPKQTAEVIRDGWYVTGDVARIDHDGFVTITDRLSRFSKIGGEMVPHLAIEEKIQECLGATEPVCAVTALPDEAKGEKIVVLLTPAAGDPAEVHRKLKESGLPNLWIPSRENFITIAAIPVLGSGKVDLKGIRDMARERVGRS